MDPHQCEHCQRFLLDFCGSGNTPEDLTPEQYIWIDCKSGAKTFIPRDRFNGISSGKCALFDLLADICTSEGVWTWCRYSGDVLDFTSSKQKITFHLATSSGSFKLRAQRTRLNS